ncbi:MAG: hypothetical protein IGS03_15695 [Candidatus Sericytochromatia bacterium]|nr:hypothetical protein [Candidatus Sericytochromatia bacterium]
MADDLGLLPFKPRLVMLRHLTQHLLVTLQSHQHASSVYLKAPQPLQLSLLQAHQATVRPACVQSAQALALPEIPVQKACYEAAVFDQATPETSYDLPELHFEIQQAEISQSCTVPASRFCTFAYGNPAKQVLEFLATLIDTALQEHGFSCQRQQQRLRFEALTQDSQLLLHPLRFAEHASNPCSVGLEKPLKQLSDPPAASPLFLWWGPYQINSQRCEVCLPAAPVSSFGQRFLDELNLQLAPTGIVARWTETQYLELRQTELQQEIQIAAAERPALNSPHRYLELPLTAGHYRPQLPPSVLGELQIKGLPLTLTPPPFQLKDVNALREWLLQRLNILLSPHHLTVSLVEDCLCFQWTGPPAEDVQLQVSPAFLQQIFGFSELSHYDTAAAALQDSLNNWHQLSARLLHDLSDQAAAAPLCAGLVLPKVLGDLTHTDALRALVWLNFPEPAQRYLSELCKLLDDTLGALAQPLAQNQSMSALQTEPLRHVNPVYPAPEALSPEPPAEAPPATFDHQI